MDADEHRQILEEERAGRVLIGIDRPAARRFFTDMSHDAIQAEIGEPICFERHVVNGTLYLGYLFALLTIGISIWAFGWWSLLVVPVALACWVGYLAGSSRGDANLTFAIVLILASVGAYFLSGLSLATKVFLLTLAAAFFFARFTYTSATTCLRALVVRNWRAFAALEGGAVVVRRKQ